MKTLLILFSLFIILNCNAQENKKEYNELLTEIIAKRDAYSKAYNNTDANQKDTIIIVARNYLLEFISTEIFPHWYGTEWDFNGMSRIPKKGKIACGYFVTNVLTDVGFKIPRIKWAQSASEVFIKKLSKNNIKRFSGVSISVIENYLKKSGNGLYLIGLDAHVGFITIKDKKIRFIHSSYYKPEIGVLSEKIDTKNPLNDSNYRIIGKLFSDEMILKWINKSNYN